MLCCPLKATRFWTRLLGESWAPHAFVCPVIVQILSGLVFSLALCKDAMVCYISQQDAHSDASHFATVHLCRTSNGALIIGHALSQVCTYQNSSSQAHGHTHPLWWHAHVPDP